MIKCTCGLIFLLFSIATNAQTKQNFWEKSKYHFSLEVLVNNENIAAGTQLGMWYFYTSKLGFGPSVRWTNFKEQLDVSLLSPGLGGIYLVPLSQNFKIHGGLDLFYSIPFFGKNSTDPILSILDTGVGLAFSPQIGVFIKTKRSVDLKISGGYFQQNIEVLYQNPWMLEQETTLEYKRYRISIGLVF